MLRFSYWAFEIINKVTHIEVLGVDVSMLGKVEVLLGHEHTLAEEVLVDLLAVGFWNEPAKG
jgi:hypothetical protein